MKIVVIKNTNTIPPFVIFSFGITEFSTIFFQSYLQIRKTYINQSYGAVIYCYFIWTKLTLYLFAGSFVTFFSNPHQQLVFKQLCILL